MEKRNISFHSRQHHQQQFHQATQLRADNASGHKAAHNEKKRNISCHSCPHQQQQFHSKKQHNFEQTARLVIRQHTTIENRHLLKLGIHLAEPANDTHRCSSYLHMYTRGEQMWHIEQCSPDESPRCDPTHRPVSDPALGLTALHDYSLARSPRASDT